MTNGLGQKINTADTTVDCEQFALAKDNLDKGIPLTNHMAASMGNLARMGVSEAKDCIKRAFEFYTEKQQKGEKLLVSQRKAKGLITQLYRIHWLRLYNNTGNPNVRFNYSQIRKGKY